MSADEERTRPRTSSIEKAQALSNLPYDKLLEECKKLKAQNSVLKKAFLQEQQKTGSLEGVYRDKESELKEKDTRLRACLEENDILTFNNKRLTKRVEQMVTEIEELKQRRPDASNYMAGNITGWIWKGNQGPSKAEQDLEVLRDELAVKIQENETIHIQMFEMKKESDQVISSLEEQVSLLRDNLQDKEQRMTVEERQHQEEIATLNHSLGMLLESETGLKSKLDSTEVQLKSLSLLHEKTSKELGTELEAWKIRFTAKVPFDDTRFAKLNHINLPSFDRENEQKRKEICHHIVTLFRQLSSYYDEFNSTTCERLRLNARDHITVPSGVREATSKLISTLPSHTGLLSTLADALQVLYLHYQQKRARISSPTKLNRKADLPEPIGLDTSFPDACSQARQAIQDVVQALKDAFELHLVKLKQEALDPQIESREYDIIDELSIEIQSFVSTITKIPATVAPLLNPEFGMTHDHCKELANSFGLLNTCLKAVCTKLTVKIGEEHKSPFVLSEMKAMDVRRMKSFTSFTTIFGKIASSMTLLLDLWYPSSTFHIRGAQCTSANISAVCLVIFEERSQKFFSRIFEQKMPETIPYNQSLQLRQLVQEYTSRIQILNIEVKDATDRYQKVASDLESSIGLAQRLRTQAMALQTENDQMARRVHQLQLRVGSETTPLVEAPSMDLISFDDVPVETQTNAWKTSQDDTALWQYRQLTQTQPIQMGDSVVHIFDDVTISAQNLNGNPIELPPLESLESERNESARKLYEVQLIQYAKQVEMADSRVMDIKAAHERMVQEVEEEFGRRLRTLTDKADATSKLIGLQEELELTRRNYEAHIKQLSEHIIGISEQTQELETSLSDLRSLQLICPKCRTWNSVGWLVSGESEGGKCSQCQTPMKGFRPADRVDT